MRSEAKRVKVLIKYGKITEQGTERKSLSWEKHGAKIKSGGYFL